MLFAHIATQWHNLCLKHLFLKFDFEVTFQLGALINRQPAKVAGTMPVATLSYINANWSSNTLFYQALDYIVTLINNQAKGALSGESPDPNQTSM